jgi:hypothetical protein
MKSRHLIALLGVTVATMAFVGSGFPGLATVPGWFYRPLQRGLGEAWPLALGGVLLPALVWGALVAARRGRRAVALLLLTGASFGAQVTFSLADAEGLHAVWRWQYQGHGEMAQVAHARRDRRIETLRDYESLVARRSLGVFTPSKPPGALGMYMAVDGVAQALPVERWLGPLVRDARGHARIAHRAESAALAFVLFPFLTALLVPLAFWLGRVLLRDDAVGYGGALLAASSPAVLLIQQHLDGAIYPALALSSCALAVTGMRRRAPWWTALGGLAWGLSVYVSFSLLPVVGLALGVLALVAIEDARAEGPWMAAHRGGWHAAAFAAGALLALGALVALLDFQLAARLTGALAYHDQWKRGVPTGPWRAWALLEFALYFGFPLAAAFLWRAGTAVVRLATQRLRPVELVPVGMLAFLGLLSAVAGTNEVARLWLFLVPFVALATATGLREAGRQGRWHGPVAWMAACQAVVALALKANQLW